MEDARSISELEALGVLDAPAMILLVKPTAPYAIGRRWGAFDSLGLRAIDDLWVPERAPDQRMEQRIEHRIIAFSAEPSYSAPLEMVALPMAIALERIFFHIQEISSVVINPSATVEGLSVLQSGMDYSLPADLEEAVEISRAEIPVFIGSLSLGKKRISDPLARAERALKNGALFEAYYLARKVREQGVGDIERAWFVELMSLSFFGLPEQTLAAYEQYPDRGGASPHALLLSARYRMLLKQLNEARTILHTLSFNEEVGAMAACELARSYNGSGDFGRAIDAASLAIQKDANYPESYLVRGVAYRGVAYPSGDEDGLREALKNFEITAKKGSFGSAEASFHAGTVLGRLGALDAAETSLRQSLFQRDRFSARDALVRVLCASNKIVDANEELLILTELAPAASQPLRTEIEAHLQKSLKTSPVELGIERQGVEQEGGDLCVKDLWSEAPEAAVNAARAVVESWKLPLFGTIEDFAILDDFINRFAPAGDFPTQGAWAALGQIDNATVARVLALYLAQIVVDAGAGTWTAPFHKQAAITFSHNSTRLPIEAFMHDRILLGASGDNFSALESIVTELQSAKELLNAAALPQWWVTATAEQVAEFKIEAAAGRRKLSEMGAVLRGTLADFEELDRIIDACFDPGGTVKPGMETVVGDDVDRFILGAAMLMGEVMSGVVEMTWCSHNQPEGISLYHVGLGRIFPVSKIQRRVYLASAADFSARLGSGAFGVAAIAAQEGIRSGRYLHADQVKDALIALVPSLKEFSDAELEGVVGALIRNTQLFT